MKTFKWYILLVVTARSTKNTFELKTHRPRFLRTEETLTGFNSQLTFQSLRFKIFLKILKTILSLALQLLNDSFCLVCELFLCRSGCWWINNDPNHPRGFILWLLASTGTEYSWLRHVWWLANQNVLYQKSTIGTTNEANNDTYCLQKLIKKLPDADPTCCSLVSV